jgi:hypothetical protein
MNNDTIYTDDETTADGLDAGDLLITLSGALCVEPGEIMADDNARRMIMNARRNSLPVSVLTNSLSELF